MNRLYKTESAVSNIVGSRIRFSIVTFFEITCTETFL